MSLSELRESIVYYFINVQPGNRRKLERRWRYFINVQPGNRRKLQRRWRASGLCIDRQLYVKQCETVNAMIKKAKTTYYSSVISSNAHNPKVLFSTVDKLLHRKPEKRYPTASSTTELVNKFADFFSNKIAIIWKELAIDSSHCNQRNQEEQYAQCVKFINFQEVTEHEIKNVIDKVGKKSCELDPVPTKIFQGCQKTLLPIITKISNESLQSGCMPEKLKEAVLKPKLKKDSLEYEEYTNFRPISNLKFLSKVIEKVAAGQLLEHLANNNLEEPFQSAYKRFHSAETSLLKVQNDILVAIDNRKCVVLLLLDMSAAFDTVDHKLLLQRMFKRFGIDGQVLKWFQSYLQNRTQSVVIDGVKSISKDLCCGVPQGSVLGPILYLLYTSPLGDIIRGHGLDFQLGALAQIEMCVKEIDMWMVKNKLKLNGDKTELLVINKRNRLCPAVEYIEVSNSRIQPSTSARNIGVTFDHHMSMDKHVTNICKNCFFHLRKIARIKEYLSTSDIQTLVHAFITSKLDNCNSLLYGLPKFLIDRLQNVQNCAARLVTGSKKYDHITPLMKQLHWLPISQRIIYKIVLITYKSLNGSAPHYINNMLKPYTPSENLRSSSKGLLTIPSVKLVNCGERSFSYTAPKLWNELPEYIRKSETLPIFKTRLKTHLFKQYYD